MTQLLRDSLRDLAEDASIAAPSTSTWADARRSRRRRISAGLAAGTVGVLIVIVAAVGMVAPTLRDTAQPTGRPSYNLSDLALPTQISQPSPWESGTSDAGALGPLAAIGGDLHRHTSWFHTSPAVYGVSAINGSYAYLDLPRLAWIGAPALSADGSHVAYWTQATPDDQTAVDGYAVYDTSTGDVAFQQVAAINTYKSLTLLWSPSGDQLLARYRAKPADGPGTAGAEVFDVADAASHPLTLPVVAAHAHDDVAWGPTGITFWHSSALTTVDPDTGAFTRDSIRYGASTQWDDLAWSPDGSRLAMAATFDDPGGPFLQVRSLGIDAPSPGFGPPSEVERATPFDAVYQVLGWRDDGHVLVYGVPTEHQAELEDSVPGIYSIDVKTGDYERLATVRLSETGLLDGIATDLAAQPFADRPGPAGHPDPRAVWARVAALLLVAALAFALLRQTRRAHDPARPLPVQPVPDRAP